MHNAPYVKHTLADLSAEPEEAVLTYQCSRTKHPNQFAGAQHNWPCHLCAADIPSLVGKAFRSGLSYDDPGPNSLGHSRAPLHAAKALSCCRIVCS